MAARHIPALPDESSIDLNAAIASTEDEILRSAMGEEELENDGDRSLEDMDEHPLDADIDDSEDEGEGEEGEGDESEDEDEDTDEDAEVGEDEHDAESGEGPDDVEGKDSRQPSARSQDDRREPPPHRFREIREQHQAEVARLTQENERWRNETAEIQRRMDALFMQVAAQGTRPGAAGGTQQPQGGAQPAAGGDSPRPDMFADPEGYHRWNDERMEWRAEEKARAIVAQQMQELTNNRVNQALHAAATGDRGWEFQAAYQALTTSLNPRDPNHRAIVQGIYNAPDPAAALFSWWDANGGAQHREKVFANLQQQFEREQPRQRQREDGGDRRPRARDDDAPRGGGRVRHQFEGPREVRVRMPPSLNGTSGGGRQQIDDPDMYDNSDESVMRYAMR